MAICVSVVIALTLLTGHPGIKAALYAAVTVCAGLVVWLHVTFRDPARYTAGKALFVALWCAGTTMLPFVFAQAFILPLLVTTAPAFVESWLGIINPESPVEMNIGALPATYGLLGILYLLGGLLFGIATLRAGILPRWPAGLLAIAAA